VGGGQLDERTILSQGCFAGIQTKASGQFEESVVEINQQNEFIASRQNVSIDKKNKIYLFLLPKH